MQQRINTYGFNNFKAFAEKMQIFSHKPITLVYGPNSIGKSSFLHSQLYFKFMQASYNPILDLDKTNFAGDTLDLGGFSNYIHKHDIDREMNFELNISNLEDIDKLLTPHYSKIVELNEKGIIDKLLHKETLSDLLLTEDETLYMSLEERLRLIKRKEDINLIKILSEDSDLKALSNNDNITSNYEKMAKIFGQDYKNSFFSYLEKISTVKDLEDKQFVETKMNFFKKHFKIPLEQLITSNDDLITMLILTSESSLELITAQLNYFKYICSLDAVTLKVSLKLEDSGIVQSLHCYVDNTLLFESEDGNTVLNEKHKLIETIQTKINIFSDYYKRERNIDLEKQLPHYGNIFSTKTALELLTEPLENFQQKYNKMSDILYVNNTTINNVFNNISFKAIRFLNTAERKTQYFGPLRFYPNREDLQVTVKDDTKAKKILEEKSIYALSIGKIIKLKDSIFWKKPFIYINPIFLKIFLKKEMFYDIINNILPSSMKLTYTGIYTSEQMWTNLINSKELQVKFNAWLSSDSRLKSQYKVLVKESDAEYSSFITFFRKLFSLKRAIKKELVFIDLRTNTEVLPKEMGLGISQIIPIILSSINSFNTDIFIEQPELHLHPVIQSEIADEFIRSAKDNNNEFVIETHSEHLLLRIMKRMRYTEEDKKGRDKSLDLTPDDICLLYVDSHKGKTFLRELKFGADGTLLNKWPNGFFEESYNEMFS